MNSSSAAISRWTGEEMQRRVSRRYRAERRFRLFGFAAIGVSVAFLAFLLISMAWKGHADQQERQERHRQADGSQTEEAESAFGGVALGDALLHFIAGPAVQRCGGCGVTHMLPDICAQSAAR